MSASDKDVVRLEHMLEAAQEAIRFIQGMSREELEPNRMLALALIKDIEIVGEAASRIAENTRAAHPEIPWVDIIGMRNRLIHAYFDINLDLVWDTVTANLPPLVDQLSRISRER